MAQTPSAQTGSPVAVENVKAKMRPRLVLKTMPDSDFRVALDRACCWQFGEWTGQVSACATEWARHASKSTRYSRGAACLTRLDRQLELQFHGDPGERELVLAPALIALSDPRLAGARSGFEDALTTLGAGRPKDVGDAVEESRKAVESAMKVLVDESHLGRAGRETTEPLINTLIAGGVVEPQTGDLLRAVARIANAQASHGAGAVVRQVPDELAAAAVSAAATAITFLAAACPNRARRTAEQGRVAGSTPAGRRTRKRHARWGRRRSSAACLIRAAAGSIWGPSAGPTEASTVQWGPVAWDSDALRWTP